MLLHQLLGSAFSNPTSFRVRLWALTSQVVRFLTLPPFECAFQPSNNSSFLDMVSLLSFPFSSLQILLSKISYEIFCRKHCKEGATIITHFWVIPQIHFFSSKKIITVRIGCQSAQKMARSWLRRLKNSNIKIWQYIFTDDEPCWQRKIQLEEKSPKSDVYGLN